MVRGYNLRSQEGQASIRAQTRKISQGRGSAGLADERARRVAQLDAKFLDGFLQGFYGFGRFNDSKPLAGAAKMIDLPVLEV
jgi:hypothetical protein